MSTVEKALQVLDLFSESRPNLRASEMARLLGWDKSTVQRYVAGLTSRGILEQDARDKSYYLGATLTRLSMLRERTHPVAEQIHSVLTDLVDETGETAHASQFIAGELRNCAIAETRIRGTRVYIDPAEALPFHASGSGIAFLSRSAPTLVKEVLSLKRGRYTKDTEVRKKSIQQLIVAAQDKGYAKNVGTFESDVIGVAAAVIGFDGYAVGAVAVATPSARFETANEKHIAAVVIESAEKLSRLYGYAGELSRRDL